MTPLPEWLVCEDVEGDRTFVFHTAEPRFLCEIFDEDRKVANPDYRMRDGRKVGGFVWLDGSDGKGADKQALGKQAATEIEVYEENLEADFADDEY